MRQGGVLFGEDNQSTNKTSSDGDVIKYAAVQTADWRYFLPMFSGIPSPQSNWPIPNYHVRKTDLENLSESVWLRPVEAD